MTPPSLPRPSAILFDWDNTLVDNWDAIHRAMNAALTAMDQAPWTFAEAKLRIRASMRDTFPSMFGDRWKEARDIFYATFRSHHLVTLKALIDAEDVTRRLAGAGLYLGVVSNKSGPLLRAEAAKLGWDRHFGRLVGAGDAKHDKPAPEPVYLATENLSISDYKSVWFVGDAAIDMQCARHAGCIGILVGGAPGEEDEIATLNPEGKVKNLNELLDLVRAAGLTI